MILNWRALKMSSSDEVNYEKKVAEEVGELLGERTKRGKWEKVVQIYEHNAAVAQSVKLNPQGDTALHLAVIDNQEETVERMVGHISTAEENGKKQLLLSSINRSGNTPLHLAAVMGSVRMCRAIAHAEHLLVGVRNEVDETPLFLAAVYGNMDAFYCLFYFCRDDNQKIAANCRVGKGGDTVLHRALNNEQFDLAFQLIHIHPDSMNWVNQQGFTPLHVLASKPTSFKTGSHIKGWRKIVYYCTFVNELEPQLFESIYERLKPSKSKEKKTPCSRFPLNYQTCAHFFTTLNHLFLMVSGSTEKKKKKKEEEQNEQVEVKDLERVDDGEELKEMKEKLKEERDERDEAPSAKWPSNYSTCIDFFQFVFSAFMIILGFGSSQIRKVRKKKEKHIWAIQVMKKLIESATPEKYYYDGGAPIQHQLGEEAGVTVPYNLKDNKVQFSGDILNISENVRAPLETPKDAKATDTAMLIAAQNGAIDIVRALFERFPLAIRDTRSDKKNVVLLAAEFRQPEVYRFLLKKRKDIENLFRAVDKDGNSALHLAATALDPKLWLITGAAFQMQWEVKWYKYVKQSVPLHLLGRHNMKGQTAREIFHESHIDLVAKGGDWLYKTSESCSLVATLIATVAFATAAAVPGGNTEKGEAQLKSRQAFFIFSISSLFALCLSSTSMIMFLAILTSRFRPKEFGSVLPWKLLIGLSCLYFSIIAMLVSFCSGHYFLINNRIHNNSVLLYTLIFLPFAFIFGIVQLPLYFDLLQAILKIVPKRSAAVVCR